MENIAISRQQEKAHAHDSAEVDSLQKLGTYLTAAFAVGIGSWSLICLSSALISNGGPVALVKSLFTAISGS
jgi:hypothetical protein